LRAAISSWPANGLPRPARKGGVTGSAGRTRYGDDNDRDLGIKGATTMQLGMVGLGRMGANLSRRLMRDGHQVVVSDVNADAVSQLAGEGAVGSQSLADFVAKLEKPRVAWVMVPAAITGRVVDQVAELMEPGDIIIDGGNSYYRDDIAKAKQLSEKGIHYVDVGTSGGVFGLERGFCLMIGGEDEVVSHLDPIFATIAPGVEAAPRTPGRTAANASSAENGYLHCGPNGAGHFVKMVHNGIEYGIMAAYAEGFDIIRNADIGMRDHAADAETAPLSNPEFYQYRIDTSEVAEVWRRGSVVASWLLDLTATALLEDPQLEGFSGRVSDSGEGRWTALAAVEEGIPAYVLTASLFERFSSRNEGDYSNKLLSAMRKQFGGHAEKAPV
jgi:6-phosphogluconate dehydrogenase